MCDGWMCLSKEKRVKYLQRFVNDRNRKFFLKVFVSLAALLAKNVLNFHLIVTLNIPNYGHSVKEMYFFNLLYFSFVFNVLFCGGNLAD